jgi:hypothetical protein
VAGFPRPRSHMIWIFGFLSPFGGITQKGIIVGGKPEAKNIEKTLLQEYHFFRIFSLKRSLSCKHSKKPGHI